MSLLHVPVSLSPEDDTGDINVVVPLNKIVEGQQFAMQFDNDNYEDDLDMRPPFPEMHPSDVPEVLVCGNLWKDYLRIDALIARKTGYRFYNKRFVPPPDMPYNQADMSLRRMGEKRNVPDTFPKWAWLFVASGLVGLLDGKYPVGCNLAVGNKLFFEVSAAPYGCMMAAIEAGICSCFFTPGSQGNKVRSHHISLV